MPLAEESLVVRFLAGWEDVRFDARISQLLKERAEFLWVPCACCVWSVWVWACVGWFWATRGRDSGKELPRTFFATRGAIMCVRELGRRWGWLGTLLAGKGSEWLVALASAAFVMCGLVTCALKGKWSD